PRRARSVPTRAGGGLRRPHPAAQGARRAGARGRRTARPRPGAPAARAGGRRPVRLRPAATGRADRAGRRTRHQRPGHLPAPAAAGATGARLPGRRPGRGAQPQRVLRPGRHRGAGQRDPGAGRRGGRPRHRRAARVDGPAGARAPHPRLGRRPRRAAGRPGRSARDGRGRRRARGGLLLGAHRAGTAGQLLRGTARFPRRADRIDPRRAGTDQTAGVAPTPGGSFLMSATASVAEVASIIDETLRDRGIEYTRPAEDVFVVVLPGERKLKTTLMLTVGKHGVRVESFVCRKPDENFEGVYKFLLRRNRRLYAVAYTLDRVGDIYLVGRLSSHA